MEYKPTRESVDQHPLPDWYHDAKFGIFVHWSLSCVPAFAPTGKGNILDILRNEGPRAMFANQPYSEWYLNSIRIKGSPAWKHHRDTYGLDFDYYDFAKDFNEALGSWDPAGWAELFREAGARYVVLVTKHHDGFLLWPSDNPNPMKPDLHASRDVVGELTEQVRARGMKMGFYYSSPFDWTFTIKPVTDLATALARVPGSGLFRKYVNSHWLELIDKFDPSVLWSDIGYPDGVNLNELFAYFYNRNPEGLVNERWGQTSRYLKDLSSLPVFRQMINRTARSLWLKGQTSPPGVHYDFTTPEYTTFTGVTGEKWESVRGIGKSFGYNRQENTDDYMSVPDLIRMLADIVSKNGNLLLNVGPKPGGEIPGVQMQRIKGVGAWLSVNGEAIYGTRPWRKAEGKTAGGIDIRFTSKPGTLFAILMETPDTHEIMIDCMKAPEGMKVHLLGHSEPIAWEQTASGITVRFGGPLKGFSPCLKMAPEPEELASATV